MGEVIRQLLLPFKDFAGNNFVTSHKLFLTLFTALILFLPSVSAFSTNLVFSGGISAQEDVIRAESGDISKDGELIAIGYRNFASVIYQSNHTTHSIVEVNAPILDISPEAVDFLKRGLMKDKRIRPTCHELLQHPWISSISKQ